MMKQFLDNSYLFGGNAPFVEELYEKYLEDPAGVPEEWRSYFDKLQLMPGGAVKDIAHAPIVESFAIQAKTGPRRAAPTEALDRKQVSVIQLVAEYRFRGCLLADLDRFKQINDRRGHLAGDAVLRQVGELLRHEARSVDLVARYGGEEFVVVMPETTLRGAGVFAERVRGKIAVRDFAPAGEEPLQLTVSIGLAGFPNDRVTSADSFIALADQALYRAKNEGRNRVRE